jgi:hypothetical protein
MTENILQIDVSRIVAYRDSLTSLEYAAIAKSLQQVMKPD